MIIRFVTTGILLMVAAVLHWLLARRIRRNEQLSSEVQQRWLMRLRNGAVLVVVLCVALIWAEEFRLLLIALLALAVALVIAMRELLRCLCGSMVKSFSRSFRIGDRIEIGSYRGDVIEHNALTTTLLEIGLGGQGQQHTGRTVVLPNSLLLAKPVTNASHTHGFVLHVFAVPCEDRDRWEEGQRDLLAVAEEECRPFLEEARRHFRRLGERQGIPTLSVEPRVTVQVLKGGEIELQVYIAVPVRSSGRIEQDILRRFLLLRKERPAAGDQA